MNNACCRRAVAAVLLLFIVAWPAPAGPVKAAEEIRASLRVYPVKLEIPVEPGESRIARISVENTAPLPARILVYARDFTRDEQGNYTFYEPGERELARSAAGWLVLPLREFELGPAQSVVVEVVLSAPENPEPGGHYALVFIEAEPLPGVENAPTGPYILGKARVGVLLMSTVAGEIDRKGELTYFSAPKINFNRHVPLNIIFENQGNVHIDLAGMITIRNWQGGDAVVLPVAERTSLPFSALEFGENWENPPLLGYFSATARIVSRDGEEWVESRSFWVFPLQETAYLLALIAVLAGAWFLFIRKFRFRLERR
jgi:hypothetical protein